MAASAGSENESEETAVRSISIGAASSARPSAIVDGRALDAAPMEMLRTAVSSLSFSDPAEAAIDRARERRKAAQLIAQLPTLVARYERRRHGLDAIPPDPS